MGFLMGMLIGAVAALLYAPKAGDEMRVEFRTRADDLKRRAEELQRIAQKLTGEAQTMGSTLIDDAKEEWKATEAGGGTTGTSGGTTTRRSGTATGGPS